MADECVYILAPSREAAATLIDALPGRRCVVWTDEASARAGLPEAELLIAGSLPAGTAALAGRLRWVHALGAGVDALLPELPAGAQLMRVTGVHEATMCEHAWALILALTRQLAVAVAQQDLQVWRRFPAASLAGRTLAVLGLGAVGGRIAAVGAAFGMRVIGTRRSGRPVPGVAELYPPTATREAIAAADVVVVTLPLTSATRGLLGAEMLAAMRPGARLVVIGRGGVIDEDALVARLRSGALAGAALDVTASEPLPPGSPLWGAPNLLLTPHMAGWNPDHGRRVAAVIAANLDRRDRGLAPLGLVDRARGY